MMIQDFLSVLYESKSKPVHTGAEYVPELYCTVVVETTGILFNTISICPAPSWYSSYVSIANFLPVAASI